MNVLVLNAGSSTQKCCLYQIESGLPDLPPRPLWEGTIEWNRTPGAARQRCRSEMGSLDQELSFTSRKDLLSGMLQQIWTGSTAVLDGPAAISVIGHRVVHGGVRFQEPTRISDDVKAEIERLAPFAPEHNPANLEGIEVAEHLIPAAPQVAVFDTAFHSTIPPAARTYAGPYEWLDQGICKYGFHGISHQFCAGRAACLLGRDPTSLRLVICHLGNGCSLAAVQGGRSIDTTMGFTPLEGLMMGTRSGSLDPEILIYLMRQNALAPEELNQILNKKSGLLGISGLSSDMRDVEKAADSGNTRARLALDMFIHRLRWHIGAMIASLGGMDALVFTAGIGEHSATIRAAACEPFGFMGLQIERSRNETCTPDADISAPGLRTRVLVIHTEEDWAIARECWLQLIKST